MSTTYITPPSARQALEFFIIDKALCGERGHAPSDDALRLLGIEGQVATS